MHKDSVSLNRAFHFVRNSLHGEPPWNEMNTKHVQNITEENTNTAGARQPAVWAVPRTPCCVPRDILLYATPGLFWGSACLPALYLAPLKCIYFEINFETRIQSRSLPPPWWLLFGWADLDKSAVSRPSWGSPLSSLYSVPPLFSQLLAVGCLRQAGGLTSCLNQHIYTEFWAEFWGRTSSHPSMTPVFALRMCPMADQPGLIAEQPFPLRTPAPAGHLCWPNSPALSTARLCFGPTAPCRPCFPSPPAQAPHASGEQGTGKWQGDGPVQGHGVHSRGSLHARPSIKGPIVHFSDEHHGTAISFCPSEWGEL